MIFTICFMVWLLPVNAFAATAVDWRSIESAVDGACHNGATDIDNNGNGWSYTHANDTVTIADGTTVTGYVNTYLSASGPGNIQNIHSDGGIFAGTINGGNFTGTVINNGTINNGTFEGTVTSEFGYKINGGTFTNAVINDGRIYGGTFEGTVTNKSYIQGGTFNGAVTSENASHIIDGTFTDTVTNEGIISGGTFTDTVTNDGIISKGTFNIIVNKFSGIVGQAPDVTYNQLINEGNTQTPNPGGDDGNIPPLNPGNNENNTTNSKDNTDNDSEYLFVEPVVIVVPEGQKYVEDVLDQLEKVPTDGKVVIDTKDWYCFNRTLAEKVTSMKDVTVIIKYISRKKI